MEFKKKKTKSLSLSLLFNKKTKQQLDTKLFICRINMCKAATVLNSKWVTKDIDIIFSIFNYIDVLN